MTYQLVPPCPVCDRQLDPHTARSLNGELVCQDCSKWSEKTSEGLWASYSMKLYCKVMKEQAERELKRRTFVAEGFDDIPDRATMPAWNFMSWLTFLGVVLTFTGLSLFAGCPTLGG